MAVEKEVSMLRDIVKCDSICAERFDEVERLVKSLFSRPEYVPLPYFTQHDVSHCEIVEKYLNQIIWGVGALSKRDFIPTPEEAMYLLSAAWLHDIGMLYGIFEGEDPSDLVDIPKVMVLRDEHELRTVRYIFDVWKLFCSWTEEEKTCLTNICVYHRQHRQIASFEPVETISRHDERPIRLVVLAALLRLADACHEDQSRVPERLMTLYSSLGMPQEAARHWKKGKLITAVDFDHTNRRITITGRCPPIYDFGLGKFDLCEIVEIVRQDIEQELRSVQNILLPYANIYFGKVDADIHRPSHLELHEEKQYLAVWPYLLDKPIGPTESVAALIQMLKFAVKVRAKRGDLGKIWQDNVFLPIISKTQELRPFDFTIRNLSCGVKDILSKSVSQAVLVGSLNKYLSDFLDSVNINCTDIAKSAANLVDCNDVLIVHGYSNNIARFLENLRESNSNTLFIVNYDQPFGKIQLGPDENERILEFANKLGFSQINFLPLASLAEALNVLQRSNLSCKVLLDTHGIVKSDDSHCKEFICKVGSYTLALMTHVAIAKNLDIKLVVLAGKVKFLNTSEYDEEVTRHERLLTAKHYKRHPIVINAMCPMPKVDFVPKELVNLVVMGDGVFEPNAIFIPGKQTTNSAVNEKRGRSLT